MKVAIDKNIKDIHKLKGYEVIYLFEDESIDDLVKTNLHCISYKYFKDIVDINLTDYNIECYKKAKITDKDWNILPPKKENKFAIIIPNYNYSECLEKCFNSILNQTYKNYEIIFVDDMSEDDSLKVAKGLLKPPHKIIQLKQKRYNGGARNEAYLHISNDVDYVWYVDSDDWLTDDRVLEDINDQLQRNQDVLFIAMDEYKNGMETTAFVPNYNDKYDAIKGWSGSCGKIIKKELATSQKCLYNEGTLKEDRNQHCKVCIYMNSFSNYKRPVYVWNRENSKSVTTKRDNIFWKTSTIRHYADTLQLYLSEKGKDDKIDNYLLERVNMTKKEVENNGDRQW